MRLLCQIVTHLLLLVLVVTVSAQGLPAGTAISPIRPAEIHLELPKIALAGVPTRIRLEARDPEGQRLKNYDGRVRLEGITVLNPGGTSVPLASVTLTRGRASIERVVFPTSGTHTLTVSGDGVRVETTLRVLPGLLSLLPPILAITLAFVARQVLISLFCGIWLGSLFLYDFNPFTALGKAVDTYLIHALADADNASILIFSLTLGGMVGVISKSGGTQGIVQKLTQWAKNPRGGQLATWAMGMFIFFDDYANSLIVGNTMRPFTDRLRISREKLSYIVDSTAAPIASIAPISTWIGFQVGLIDQAFTALELEHDAYNLFIRSIPFAAYSILALLFVFLIAVTLRDFGPMFRAEQRALHQGKVLRDGAQPLTDSAALDMIADEKTPLRWYNAFVPVAVVILVTLVGLYVNGRHALGEAAATASLSDIFGNANSFNVLLWASFSGLTVALVMALAQRILTLNEAVTAAVNGYKAMLLAAMILVLAWAIGDICTDLKTADYVIHLTRGLLSPHLIPALTFVVAAFIAFSTGTSWATMAILTPIVIPIAYHLPLEAGLSTELSQRILIATIGAVLSGAVFGDHCSPISDTTILSSMASAADHVDHVRTQLPYALSVATVAVLTGYLPSGWGWSAFLMLTLGAGILTLTVLVLGKKSATETPR